MASAVRATEGPAYRNSMGSMWHSRPSSSIREFTSACFCNLIKDVSLKITLNVRIFYVQLVSVGWLTYPVVFLLLTEVHQATEQEGRAENKEEVREDRAQEGVLHHIDLPLSESKYCNYQLRCVPACRVQKPSHCKQFRTAQRLPD